MPLYRSKKRHSPTGERALFLEIWDERPHKSEISGETIYLTPGDDMWVNCFSHLLSKKLYPEFRLNKNNILIKTPYEHDLYHTVARSDLEQTEGWKKVFDKVDALKSMYRSLYG